MALVPLPGSMIYDQIHHEGRILTYDWSKYDAHYVVFKPLKMSPFELQWEIIKGLMKFYSWKEVMKRFSTMDIRNTILKIYGHFVLKHWKKFNLGWLDSVKGLGDGLTVKGKLIQLSLKEAAHDIYAKVETMVKQQGYPFPWMQDQENFDKYKSS